MDTYEFLPDEEKVSDNDGGIDDMLSAADSDVGSQKGDHYVFRDGYWSSFSSITDVSVLEWVVFLCIFILFVTMCKLVKRLVDEFRKKNERKNGVVGKRHLR